MHQQDQLPKLRGKAIDISRNNMWDQIEPLFLHVIDTLLEQA